MEKTDLSRRVFVQASIAAACSLAAACALFAHKREPDLTLTPVSGSVRVPRNQPGLASGAEGVVIRVEGLEEKILVFRTPENAWAAVSMTCTHRGCDVEYEPAAGHIVCPCHGSEYKVDGANLKGPARRPLKSFPVYEDREDLAVAVSA